MWTDYKPLDSNDLRRVLSHISHPVVLACIAFYYESDLSLMDCLLLRWESVSFETGTISLNQGVYPLSNREMTLLKRWRILVPKAALSVFPIGMSPEEGATLVLSSFQKAVAKLGEGYTFRDLTLAVLRRNMSTIDTLRNKNSVHFR